MEDNRNSTSLHSFFGKLLHALNLKFRNTPSVILSWFADICVFSCCVKFSVKARLHFTQVASESYWRCT